MNNHKILLVGDNPFHGVSHLSQSRARSRNNQISNPDYCAELIKIATENGADGFMFSVSDFTLNIVSSLSEKEVSAKLSLRTSHLGLCQAGFRLGTPDGNSFSQADSGIGQS